MAQTTRLGDKNSGHDTCPPVALMTASENVSMISSPGAASDVPDDTCISGLPAPDTSALIHKSPHISTTAASRALTFLIFCLNPFCLFYYGLIVSVFIFVYNRLLLEINPQSTSST